LEEGRGVGGQDGRGERGGFFGADGEGAGLGVGQGGGLEGRFGFVGEVGGEEGLGGAGFAAGEVAEDGEAGLLLRSEGRRRWWHGRGGRIGGEEVAGGSGVQREQAGSAELINGVLGRFVEDLKRWAFAAPRGGGEEG